MIYVCFLAALMFLLNRNVISLVLFSRDLPHFMDDASLVDPRGLVNLMEGEPKFSPQFSMAF